MRNFFGQTLFLREGDKNDNKLFFVERNKAEAENYISSFKKSNFAKYFIRKVLCFTLTGDEKMDKKK